MNRYILILLILLSFSSCSDNKFQICFEADNTNGLIKGNYISLMDLTIGKITNISLNKTNKVNIIAEFDRLNSFPIDSKFSIESSDVLGTKMIGIELGKSKALIQSTDTISLQIQTIDNFEFLQEIASDFLKNNPLIESLDSLQIQIEELNKKLDKQSQQ
jgi:ABC-type transporter Mla subunit MlaD